jgi:TorA maturation chaperone TorD
MEENVRMEGLAREDICRTLSACFYQPGPELREEQVFEKLARAAAFVEPALEEKARALGESFAAASLDDLLLDYTRLFLGPFDIRAKPYGSVWLEGERVVMGDTTMAVRELYAVGGFELAADFREVPDHVAAELEFLYLLVFKENEARRAGDAQAVTEAKELKRRFLGEHLGRWIAPFTAAVRQASGTDFYRQLAELTDAFVSAESSGEPC